MSKASTPPTADWKDKILPGQSFGVHAYPKSPRDVVEGWEEDAAGHVWLRVRIRAVAEDGAANKAIAKLLGKALGGGASAITLVQGATSRYKRLQYDP
jgi:uncharacterized protein YggU (UPF0235/DUF167 family)